MRDLDTIHEQEAAVARVSALATFLRRAGRACASNADTIALARAALHEVDTVSERHATSAPDRAKVALPCVVRFLLGGDNADGGRVSWVEIRETLAIVGAPGAVLSETTGWHPQYGKENGTAVEVFLARAVAPRFPDPVAFARRTAEALARNCRQDSVGFFVLPAADAGLVTADGAAAD